MKVGDRVKIKKGAIHKKAFYKYAEGDVGRIIRNSVINNNYDDSSYVVKFPLNPYKSYPQVMMYAQSCDLILEKSDLEDCAGDCSKDCSSPKQNHPYTNIFI